MDTNLHKQLKTRLLVSVRNAREAKIAHSTQCVGIIDLKEPINGSLGSVSFDVARQICSALPLHAVKSIAMGESCSGPIWPEVKVDDRTELLSQFQFAKVGLSGLSRSKNWVSVWKRSFDLLPPCVERVAVAYADCENADSPPIEKIITNAATVGCTVLLIDTFRKDHGSMLEYLPLDKLEKHLRFAQCHSLKVVIAGSLKLENIRAATHLRPDFIAVRGAVCRTDRSSEVDAAKINELGLELLAVQSSQEAAPNR